MHEKLNKTTWQQHLHFTFVDNMFHHSKYTHLILVFDFILTRIISEGLNFNRFYVFNTKEFALVPDCYISEVASFANISQSDSVLVQFLSLLNQNLVFENEYGISVGERRFGASCNTKQRQVMTTTGVKGASLSELQLIRRSLLSGTIAFLWVIKSKSWLNWSVR